jgi:hypothetical protein
MPFAVKRDGWAGSGTNYNSVAARTALLYVTNTSGSAGDFISIHPTDTANPSGLVGESYRIADADNVPDAYNVVGVATAAWSAAGMIQVQVSGYAPVANVDSGASVAIGDNLSIGTTAGRAIEYTGTNPEVRVIGSCQSMPSGNLAAVLLNPHPRFGAI